MSSMISARSCPAQRRLNVRSREAILNSTYRRVHRTKIKSIALRYNHLDRSGRVKRPVRPRARRTARPDRSNSGEWQEVQRQHAAFRPFVGRRNCGGGQLRRDAWGQSDKAKPPTVTSEFVAAQRKREMTPAEVGAYRDKRKKLSEPRNGTRGKNQISATLESLVHRASCRKCVVGSVRLTRVIPAFAKRRTLADTEPRKSRFSKASPPVSMMIASIACSRA